MRFKILILVLVLSIGLYFQADILKLRLTALREISEIEKISVPGFTEFRKDIAAIGENNSQVFVSLPLKVIQEVPSSFLTQKGIIAETNIQRAGDNLLSLKENIQLNEAAKAKVQDMFANQYFEHVSPAGRGPDDLAKSAGYDYLIIGENLALGNFENNKKLLEAWMASPGHRANILNSKYTEIGVAIEKGTYEGRSVWMAVQEFGRPASDCPKVSQALKIQIDDYNIQIDGILGVIKKKKAEIESLSVSDISGYNNTVNEYNDLIQQYNILVAEVKVFIAAYNNQVSVYNECLK